MDCAGECYKQNGQKCKPSFIPFSIDVYVSFGVVSMSF